MKKIYIIGNSHIDPVWIWNRSSGRFSWLNTARSVVGIMDEQEDIKFSASSSAMHRWIEHADPGLFKRIQELAEEKRWEIAGGWEVESDAVISREIMIQKQAEFGKQYFKEKFNIDVKIGYNIDAFGHAAGLPKILNQAGMQYYVITRPLSGLPYLFSWRHDEHQVTVLKVFENYNLPSSINENEFRNLVEKLASTELEHQTFFFGLGDHGGGLSRKHLRYLRNLQNEGKYNIFFATLQDYFDAVSSCELPTVSGELGPAFRGCYSACHEIKNKIYLAGEMLLKAETLKPQSTQLNEAWKELLFNHFHDILPGTSTREAVERDIFSGLGMVMHSAITVIDEEIVKMAGEAPAPQMPEGGLILWNHHAFPAHGIVEIDGFTDPNATGNNFNSLVDYDGKIFPLAIQPPATTFGPCGESWGRLTSVVLLAPGEKKLLAYHHENKSFEMLGFEQQKELLKQLSFDVFYDDSRTWGFGLDSFGAVTGRAELKSVTEYFNSAVCSILRAEYDYRHSTITLDIHKYTGIDEFKITVRMDWQEINRVLKLSWSHNLKQPRFFTNSIGSVVERKLDYWRGVEWKGSEQSPCHPSSEEWSMIDFAAVQDEQKTCGIISGDLHSIDHAGNALRITLVRPVLYADHAPFARNYQSGWMDIGLQWRRLWLFRGDSLNDLSHQAQLLLSLPECREITVFP